MAPTEQNPADENAAFRRYRDTGAPEALALVFDLTAARLLLVAMHLTKDASQAEDLVQATFLHAIKSAAQFDPTHPVMPWLIGILSHRAADAARHRLGRKSQSLVDEPVDSAPDPLTHAERREVNDQVARALDGLPSLYRQVLVLRLLHGLRAVDIAHTLERSPATVRTQLRRGFEILRQGLPSGLAVSSVAALLSTGGMAQVRERVKAEAASALTSTGVAGVTLLTKAIAALLLLGVAVVGYRSVASPPTQATLPQVVVAGPLSPGTSEDVLPTTNATASAIRTPAPATTRKSIPPLEATETEWIGRCIDRATKVPLANCRIKLRGYPRNQAARDRLDEADQALQQECTTGADGRFRFRFAASELLQVSLSVEMPGRVTMSGHWITARQGFGKTVDFGDVLMRAGCRVTGRVVDKEGRPISKTVVYLRLPFDPTRATPTWGTLNPLRYPCAVCDANGEFAFASAIPVESWSVSVQRQTIVEPVRVLVGPGDTVKRLEIVVRGDNDPDTLRGSLVDGAGAPVARALIWTVPKTMASQIRSAYSREDGSFVLSRRGLTDEGRVQLLVRDPRGRANVEEHKTKRIYSWGQTGIRIVLRRKSTMRFLVTDASTGKPVEDYGVRVFLDPRQGPGELTPLRGAGRHPGGRLLLKGVSSGWNFVTVEPGGTDLEPSPLYRILVDAHTSTQRIQLHAAVSRVLEVRLADGSPVAGSRVELVRSVRGKPVTLATTVMPRGKIALFGPRNYSSSLSKAQLAASIAALNEALLLQNGATDDQGRLILRSAPYGDLAVRLTGPGHVPMVVQEVAVKAGLSPLKIRVQAGATVSGRLLPAHAAASLAPPEELVRSQRDLGVAEKQIRASLWPRLQLQCGKKAFPPTDRQGIPIHDDGTFRFKGVPPGDWRIFLMTCYRTGEVGRLVNLCEGEVRKVSLDVSSVIPGTLVAKVLVDGEPLSDARYRLFFKFPNGLELPSLGRTNAKGLVRRSLAPGDYRFDFQLPIGDGSFRWLRTEAGIQLTPGSKLQRSYLLTRSRLHLRILLATGEPYANRELTLGAGRKLTNTQTLRTDDKGCLVMDPAPLGEFQLEAWPTNLNSPPQRSAFIKANPTTWTNAMTTLRVNHTPAGKSEAEIEVRLPAARD